MTNINQPRERINFFVTHVRTNGPWLQICGQMDRNNAREVERLISILKDGFDRGIGKTTTQNIHSNICCAYHEDNYYRAKIIKVESDVKIYVEFVDYGNSEYVHISQIRLLETTNEGLKLQSIPSLMIEFPLTTVVPINNMWSRAIIDVINNLLRYHEFPVEIYEYGNQQKFTLYYNGRDFAEYLVTSQMALMTPTTHEIRSTKDIQMIRQQHQLQQQQQQHQHQQSQYHQPQLQPPQLQPPQLHQPQLQLANPMYRPGLAPTPVPCEPHGVNMNMNINDNFHMKLRQPRSIPTNKPLQENWRRPYPSTVQQMRPPSSISPRSQDSAAFKSRNLERDTRHQVLVSDVEDGPLKFNVQLQSCAQELDTLSRNINSIPLKPLSEPPIHGAACLALNSKTNRIRRAVVSTVINTYKVKVWYCDYGDQEILPHSSIYEIPPNYSNPQALSVIFTLSGVRELNVTPEMKQYFKDLVLGKTLTLVVMPREDSPLMHYGNLFFDDKNVLEMILEAFPDSTIKFLEAPYLTSGTRENVQVSYVDSCSKFFVQLNKNVLDMESLANSLTECVKIAPPIKAATIKVGLKCLAHSSADSEWYRAEVIKVVDNYVTVHYVDYGNDETIPCNAIRSIRSEELTKIPVQALQCILNGFEFVPYNPEVDDKFEAYVLDKPLVMTVLDVKPSGLIVDLYDSNVKPIANISAKLRNGTLEVSTSASVSQSQSATTSTTQYQDDVSDTSKRNFREKRSDMKTQLFSSIHPHTAKAKSTKNAREENDSSTSKNHNDSYPQSHENSSFENTRAKNWKNTENEDKRYNSREPKPTSRDWSGHCDRSNRDYSRNDRSAPRYDRNDINDRFDNDNNMNGRRDRSSGRGRISSSSRDKFDRSNAGDISWSDKDSNASSRGSGRRGRRPDRGGPRGGSSQSRAPGRGNSINGGITGARRDRPRSTSNDNENDFERNIKSNNRSNDFNNYTSSDNTRFKQNNQRYNDQHNDRNKKSEIDVWDPVTAVTSTDESSPAGYSSSLLLSSSSTVQITPPNITLGAIKHCEIVFITSPTDFHVQLRPDNLELDPVMNKIAQIYETGGNNLTEANAKVGTSCVAQYSEDLKWYRAVIQSVEPFGVTVRFVDYGNVESVTFDKIKELDVELAKLPIQAINCKLLAASKTVWDTNEINEFTSLVELKSLEAEFIAEENNIYEVLIREVVDNETFGPYLNERFSNGADLMQAKEVTKNKNRSSRDGKLTHAATDNYAPLEQTWIEPRINLPMEEGVIVTWLIDPDNFYCQLLGRSKDFRSMMNEMQKIYSKRQPARDNIAVGSTAIAVFADDGAFYRAEVLQTMSDTFVVRYVDFGNTATVKSSEIYRVDKKFMDLPKQAVCCSLKSVIPPGGSWSKSIHDDIDCLFNVENLRCNFLQESNNKYLVSLTHDGQDLADIIVQKGLAASPNSHEAEENVDSNHHLSQIDISYLRGQILRVKISKVESVNKFYIQLPSAAASEKIIDDYMANQDQKVMPKLLSNEVCLGAGCLVHTKKGWRRAVVVNFITQTTNYDVRFIDTGEIDVVPLNCMLALSGELSVMQKQAVECSLATAVSSSADNTFRNLVENNEVIIRVNEVNYNRLVVDVFDESGKKIKLQNEADESISPICPMPIFFHQHQVAVSHVNNSKSIWLKRDADQDTNAALLNELFEYYSTSGQQLDIEINKFCAAQCSDGNWYRAKIVTKMGSGAVVLYIDYGNTEEVSLDKLKELERKFFKHSQLAIEVRLTFNLGGGAKEQEILSTYVLNQSFNATLQLNANNDWIASLNLKSGQPLEDQLRELGLLENGESQAIEVTKKATLPVINEPEDLIIGGKFKVVVSHVENPTQFWIQRLNDLPALEQLEKKLQDESLNYLPIEGVPEENLICVALDTANSLWNRAEVIVADTEMVTVRYIDYGNTDVLLDMNKIKQLPDSMKSIKWYATKCRLDLIPIDCEDWSESAINYFADKTLENENLTAVVIADGSSKRIDLVDDNGSITQMLVNENLAKQIQAHEDVIDEVVENVLDPRSAFICHINSPDEFWVQEEKSVADLEHIADRFLVADMFPKVTQIVPGELCVAKFPDDNSWYRARIISHGSSGTNVFYIDYGNSAVSIEIRVIPDDVKNIPPLSRKSRLPLPPGIEKWSEEARDEFIKMADDGATIFFLDVIEEGETSTVKLTLNGENIVDLLEKFCEKKIAIESSAEVNPETDNSINKVFVSHVNSPYDFYVQEQKHTEDLDMMTERLTTAETFLPLDEIKEELLCVAQFPEDSAWYRARVLSHGNEGTQIIYIDYGNTAVTTELRKIPNDLETLPPLSRHCRLASPANVEWSCEAYQEFIQLVDDGNSEFIMIVKDETDEISTVQLIFNGEDVTEKLNQYCKKPVPVIEERLPPLGEETFLNVMISHVISPSEFWIQAENKISELESMAERLNGAENFSPLEAPIDGIICVAKFPEDSLWYRAKVLTHNEAITDIEVSFIDYGNSSLTSEIRQLPEDFAKIPPLSKFCSLKMPDDVECWSLEACEKFIELVSDGQTMFEYKELYGKDPSYVDLKYNGQDVVEILASLCSKTTSSTTTVDQKVFSENNDCKIEKHSMCENIKMEKEFNSHTSEKDCESNFSSSTSGVDVLTNSDNSHDGNPFEKVKTSEIVNSTLKQSDAIVDDSSAVDDTLTIDSNWTTTEKIEKGSINVDETLSEQQTVIELTRNLSTDISSEKMNRKLSISEIEKYSVKIADSTTESITTDLSSTQIKISTFDTTLKESSNIDTKDVTMVDFAVETFIEKEKTVSSESKTPANDDSIIELEQKTTPADINADDVIEIGDSINIEEKLTPVEVILDEEQNIITMEEEISPRDIVVEEQDSIIVIEDERSHEESSNEPIVTEKRKAVTVSDGLVVDENEVNAQQETLTPDSSIPPSPIGDMPRYGRRNSTPHEEKIVPGSINKGIELITDEETIEVEMIEKSSV
ncbi:uncharacterized protein LOC141531270 isoform X2 [Cotesia typhae]|uniref:uncharacterized protein LOC141531270 isoform X2 n=1 Tax=Cotesia typhae TaxID=2053667 RepID=UPI003D682CE6